MSSYSSPGDADTLSAHSFASASFASSSTAPSSVTSEPSFLVGGSPALKPMDDPPAYKPPLISPGQYKLATREPQAPVPSDFPGKKPERFSCKILKGDFEMKDHFYERCRKSSCIELC